MLTSFIVVLFFAAAMAAPATPNTGETLRTLVDPSPELFNRLNQVSAALTGTSNPAAGSPEANLGREMANLNLVNGLNSIILRVLRGVIEKLTPESPTQSGPAAPSGNDIFNTGPSAGAGSDVNPSIPVAIPRFNFLNPLLRLFFPGGSSPFSMFYPSMMGDFLDGFGEFM